MKQMSLIEMDGFLKGKCIPRDLKVDVVKLFEFDTTTQKLEGPAKETTSERN